MNLSSFVFDPICIVDLDPSDRAAAYVGRGLVDDGVAPMLAVDRMIALRGGMGALSAMAADRADVFARRGAHRILRARRVSRGRV